MNNIYDNGTMVLGSVKNIKEYLLKHMEHENFGAKEILEDISQEKDDTIVAINYDCGMGYTIDYWQENDIVKENK